MSLPSRAKALYIPRPFAGSGPIHVTDVFPLESLETVKTKPAFYAVQCPNAFWRRRRNVASSVNLAPHLNCNSSLPINLRRTIFARRDNTLQDSKHVGCMNLHLKVNRKSSFIPHNAPRVKILSLHRMHHFISRNHMSDFNVVAKSIGPRRASSHDFPPVDPSNERDEDEEESDEHEVEEEEDEHLPPSPLTRP